MHEDISQLLDPVLKLAREASGRIMELYNTNFDVEQKEDKTPLTAADMAAHEIIVAGLTRLTPGIPVLSEESAKIPFAERSRWQRYWLVDPLDGTREFIKRNGEFTVNIALIEDTRSVLGVICAPVNGLCYYAAKGNGSHKADPGQAPVRITARKIPADTVTVAGSRSHRGSSLDRFLNKLGRYDLVSMGSSLKSCLIAEGKADIYPRLGPTSEWDTAAAQCIVEEAGGHITDTEMRPLRYNTKDSLLNPHFLVFGDDSVDWKSYLDC